MHKYVLSILVVLLLLSCQDNLSRDDNSTQEITATPNAQIRVIENGNGCDVRSVPKEYSFDPFYEKYCDADGIPIISSDDVDNLALMQAYYVIMNMLMPIPEVRQELISNGAYFAIIGKYEKLASLPEYAHIDLNDRNYWDRGLGGSKGFPITSSAEENLLCWTWDSHFGENITVHEFAHTISLIGLGTNFETLLSEFSDLYETAIQQGLWINTYAGSDIHEYWAEGVQSYFNANLESESGSPDGVHNHVNSRKELLEYDPALYGFISRIFRGFEWTPSCPQR